MFKLFLYFWQYLVLSFGFSKYVYNIEFVMKEGKLLEVKGIKLGVGNVKKDEMFSIYLVGVVFVKEGSFKGSSL